MAYHIVPGLYYLNEMTPSIIHGREYADQYTIQNDVFLNRIQKGEKVITLWKSTSNMS
jgi:hypothetical protein